MTRLPNPHLSRMSRRSLLQLLGLTGLASLTPRGSRARAQSAATIPKRIVFFYTNHGSHRPAWLPIGANGAAATETAYSLGEIHQPLTAYKDDLLLIDGLDMLSSDIQTGPAANAHIRGHCHSMTAEEMANENLAGGISIDQHIAQALKQAGVVTAVPSLEIGVDPNQESRISFSGPGQQLPIESNPTNTWNRLFPSGAATSDTSAQQEQEKAARTQSVLDFVAGEFGELAPRLGREDRLKLEAHAQLVRDLETRLATSAGRTCSAPSLASVGSRSEYATYYQQTGDAFMRLIQSAFACDLTRVVTFNMEAIPDELSGYNDGFGTSDMHDLIHKVAQSSDPLSRDAAAVSTVVRFHTEYAKQFAKLLGYLAAVPESDGTSVLQHTIVLWCGEIAEGNHDLHRLPWLIAGQGGGSVRTGRFLEVPRAPEPRAHNDLFVALANAMGSSISTFGAPSVCKGPLALV